MIWLWFCSLQVEIYTSSSTGTLEIIVVCVFSIPVNNRVIRLHDSSSKMILRINEHIIVYSGSGPSIEVIAICPAD
jgi:hypothetical protein